MRLTGTRGIAIGLLVCLQAVTSACGSRSGPGSAVPKAPTPIPRQPDPPAPATAPPPGSVSDECALIASPGEPIATVGLNQRIDPSHAPSPANDSERLVFRQLYETLVSVDCTGRARPGLASSWRLDDEGRTWLVTVRQDARFSDGSPVTAADVRAAWAGGSVDGELLPRVSRLVQSVAIAGERELAIALRHQQPRNQQQPRHQQHQPQQPQHQQPQHQQPQHQQPQHQQPRHQQQQQSAESPVALAHTDLAVARHVAGSTWPLGTRSSRMAVEGDATKSRAASVLTIVRDDGSALRLRVAPGDPRDLLDQDVDLLLTRDVSALRYAATLPHLQSVPLAWQRTYVLLMPGRARSSPSVSLSDEARQALAIDAIRGEARGARGPFWWEMASECGDAASVASDAASSVANQSSLAPRIVYDANDAAARDLAERFVGLARASGSAAAAFLDVILPDRPRRTYQRAAGLSGDALAEARRLGSDAAYVVAVDSRSLDPCRDLRALMDSARWLDPAAIVPLVDTRMQAVVRRGRTGLTAELDGGVLVANPANPANPESPASPASPAGPAVPAPGQR